ncbi:hypothetical protein AAGT95_00320 [Salinicola lusitanus]|uniref:Uncharacterized protein n=1 Tax=Salinicola lusitanus TaxID=1949085 RepID=A0ABZ3CTI2_9GAMM
MKKRKFDIYYGFLLCQFFCIFLAVAFLVSLGPNLQFYFFAIIDPGSTSIYDSAFNGQMVRFPSLLDWLGGVLSIPVLIVSLAISSSTFKVKSPRKVHLRLVLSCFFSWCLVDLAIGIFDEQAEVAYYLQCLLANLAGSVFLVLLMAGLFSVLDLYIKIFSCADVVVKLTASFLLVALSFALCCITYYAIAFLFKPLPVRIQLYTAYPASGYVKTIEDKKIKIPTIENPKTSLLPNNSMSSRFYMVSIDKGISFNFDANSEDQNYILSVATVEGCLEPNQALEAIASNSWRTFENVAEFQASFDKGTSQVVSETFPKELTPHPLEEESLTSFWYKPSEKEGEIDIQQFFSNNIFLHYSTDAREQIYLITAHLLEKKGNVVSTRERELDLNVNGRSYSYMFNVDPSVELSSKVNCSSLGLEGNAQDSNFYSVNVPLAGMVIVVKPDIDKKVLRLYTDRSQVDIAGGMGTRSIKNLRLGELVYSDPDKVDRFSLSGDIRRVLIDGYKKEVTEADVYSATGDFTVAYTNGGWMAIDGTADFLWNRKERLNSTKWESVDAGWSGVATIIGSILIAVGWVLRSLVFPSMVSNQDYKWKLF